MAAKAKAEDKAPAAKGRSKLMLIAVAGLLVLGGGGAAAYFLGLFGGEKAAHAAVEHASDAEAAEAAPHGEEAAAEEHGDGEAPAIRFVDLPDAIVNLQADNRRSRFLKLRIALEVESAKAAETVQMLTPRIMDSFQMYLRALTVDDVQGSAGMQRLKEEMIARVNLAIEPVRIRDLLFKEMLVQ